VTVESLAFSLLKLPAFRDRLDLVIADSVATQFVGLERKMEISGFSHDWAYLLGCASLLAQVRKPECEDAALRIAHHSLTQSASASIHDAACIIFSTLTNSPSIKLAESRNLVEPDTLSRLTLPLRTAWFRRELEHLVVMGDGTELSLNRFQKDVWEAAGKSQVLSITAPTSSGKSFLLCQWLAEYFRENAKAFVVYLVPTRALIQQVESDLRKEFAENKSLANAINISSLPMIASIKEQSANVMVLTQERLHLLLLGLPDDQRPALMIVDEAHKFGDGARGVLLNNVIDTIALQSTSLKLLFASPMVSNPEILLRGRAVSGGKSALASFHITVNQNLLWVSQIPRQPTQWMVEACINEKMTELGQIRLKHRPTASSKRLTLVAKALADPIGGNLVYADGAADAEKAAHQLWDIMPVPQNLEPELQGLIDLVKKYIHPKYALANTLSRRVAFHYGNMPLLIRTEIENLFKNGQIQFLVCTSTLVEGVNLPCKSIFVRGPHKGRGRPMNETDFWNLAGRAGRLGKEFQGNVICIDPHDKTVWKTPPPTKRSTYPIKPASDSIFDEFEKFIDYIVDQAPDVVAKKRPEYDQLLSYLISNFDTVTGLLGAPMCASLNSVNLEKLEAVIGITLKSLTIPLGIVNRNPGISPFAMQRLLKYFQGRAKPVEELLPVLPESDDAVLVFNNIFARINGNLAPVFSPSSRTFALSILVVDWMRGLPLARIISSRVNYLNKKDRPVNLAFVIRTVMEDVEQIARFTAPRYVSCYIDILRYFLHTIDREELADQIQDVNLWLEFGASQQTQLSLMGLGFSRTTAISLSEFIIDDSLSEESVIEKLLEIEIESLGLPLAIQREVDAFLATIRRD
jgi:hypothetical protein